MNKDTTNGTSQKNSAERDMPFEYENAYEEWSTAGIGNTFLFGKVMTSNPNLLLELLQYSLPEFHIQQIENPEKEADVKLSIDAHGVRLDVITTDDRGRRLTHLRHMGFTNIRSVIPVRKTRTLYSTTESQRWS